MKTYDELLAENNSLQSEITKLKNKQSEAQALIAWYEHQLKLNRTRMYGASSERNMCDGQISFFNEPEAEKDTKAEEPEIEETVTRIKKRKSKHKKSIEDLPVETIEYTLEDTSCPVCGNEMHIMKKEVRREIIVVPAEVKVIEHVAYSYSCRNCERNEIEVPVIKADAPKALLPKSLVSSSLLSHIIYDKYVNHVPLYRQEQDWNRKSVDITRKNMANWIIKGAEILKPIYQHMKNDLKSGDIIHADETTLEVLCEPDRPAQTKSYMWVYCSDRFSKPIALYNYTPTRGGEYAREFLKNYSGYLITDGYAGYNKVENTIRCACYAHVRRKFADIIKTLPKESKNTEAHKGLKLIDKIFAIESLVKDKSPEEIYKIRQEKSKQAVDDFFAWAENADLLPSSPTAKAINYAIKLKEALYRFLEDGRIEVSNNLAERAVKPFVIGRKNWLFCNTPNGAKSSAIIFSIVQTAIMNGLKPEQYLTYVFDTLKENRAAEIDELLPYSKKLPDMCKMKNKEN